MERFIFCGVSLIGGVCGAEHVGWCGCGKLSEVSRHDRKRSPSWERKKEGRETSVWYVVIRHFYDCLIKKKIFSLAVDNIRLFELTSELNLDQSMPTFSHRGWQGWGGRFSTTSKVFSPNLHSWLLWSRYLGCYIPECHLYGHGAITVILLRRSLLYWAQFSDVVSFISIALIMLALQLDLSVSLTLYSKSFRFCHGKKSFQRRSQTLDTCKGKLQIRSCVEFEHEAC